jgi:1-acyl-sn-glycerol-3-phosphate acyltransferase
LQDFFPFFLVFLSREKWFPLAWRLKKIWAHVILFFSGITYSIKKEGTIENGKAYVICPNHASYLDIVLTNIAFPNYFHFMGKAELLNIPLFNIFFKKMNIPVNRGSIKDSHKAFNGAFRLAIETQVPVVPITFLDNWKIFPDKPGSRFLCKPGHSRIIIHQPINTTGMNADDVVALKQQVYKSIALPLANGSIGEDH